jgi:hypothetical protein
MAFNDETSKVSEYFKTGTDAIIKESEKILEISRLNLDILSMKKEINSLYIELGKCVYKEYSHHSTISKNLNKCCEKLSALNEDISKAERNISKIKST